MSKPLILYTSKSGVTKDIAHQIETHLNHNCTIFDLKDLDETILSSCNTIILGAPIYMGYIRKPMRKFVFKHLNTLLKKSLFLYVIGVDTNIDLDKYLAMSYPQVLLQHARHIDHLGGEFRANNQSLLSRFIINKIKEEFAKERDLEENINQDKIKDFAMNILKYEK